MNFENETIASSTGAELIPVVFEFTNPTARSVGVAGTFNHWDPSRSPMTLEYGGHWVKIDVLPAGTYEYRLVVDGVWRLDPANQSSVSNGLGGQNSVFTLARSSEGAHRLNAMKIPFEIPTWPLKRAIEERVQLICNEMALLAEAEPAWKETLLASGNV